jgi:hypothetical protein
MDVTSIRCVEQHTPSLATPQERCIALAQICWELLKHISKSRAFFNPRHEVEKLHISQIVALAGGNCGPLVEEKFVHVPWQ